jgi:hypothetical protein
MFTVRKLHIILGTYWEFNPSKFRILSESFCCSMQDFYFRSYFTKFQTPPSVPETAVMGASSYWYCVCCPGNLVRAEPFNGVVRLTIDTEYKLFFLILSVPEPELTGAYQELIRMPRFGKVVRPYKVFRVFPTYQTPGCRCCQSIRKSTVPSRLAL